MDFDSAAAGAIFGYFLVVARIGSALVFMPGFGETQVPSSSKTASCACGLRRFVPGDAGSYYIS